MSPAGRRVARHRAVQHHFITAFAGHLVTHGSAPAEQAHSGIHGYKYNVAFNVSSMLFAVGTILAIAFIRRPPPALVG